MSKSDNILAIVTLSVVGGFLSIIGIISNIFKLFE